MIFAERRQFNWSLFTSRQQHIVHRGLARGSIRVGRITKDHSLCATGHRALGASSSVCDALAEKNLKLHRNEVEWKDTHALIYNMIVNR